MTQAWLQRLPFVLVAKVGMGVELHCADVTETTLESSDWREAECVLATQGHDESIVPEVPGHRRLEPLQIVGSRSSVVDYGWQRIQTGLPRFETELLVVQLDLERRVEYRLRSACGALPIAGRALERSR